MASNKLRVKRTAFAILILFSFTIILGRFGKYIFGKRRIVHHGHLCENLTDVTFFPQEMHGHDSYFSMDISKDMLLERRAKLPPLLQTFKNPCWRESLPRDFKYENAFYYKHECKGNTEEIRSMFDRLSLHYAGKQRRLRCYPYFYLAGVKKSATTDIYTALHQYHPHVIPPIRKEPHFWTARIFGNIGNRACGPIPENEKNASFADYLNMFDTFALADQLETATRDESVTGITGDFSPSSFHMLPNWDTIPGNVGKIEPKVTLAHILYSLNPRTRIIFILRDPVERLLSDYMFTMGRINMSASMADFNEMTTQQITNMFECSETHTIRRCVYDYQNALAIGMYDVLIKDWLMVFPRDQILILRFEDYTQDRIPVLDTIVEFLELDPSLVRHIPDIVKSPGYRKPEWFPELRQRVRDFYRPHVLKLEDMLGKSMNWGY